MIEAGLTTQHMLSVLPPPDGDYFIALYTANATISKKTSHYTPDGEVIGPGYQAGGIPLKGYKVGHSPGVVWVDWEDPVWLSATIKARGAMIYDLNRQRKSIVIMDFGSEISSTNGPFIVELPPPGASAIVRHLY